MTIVFVMLAAVVWALWFFLLRTMKKPPPILGVVDKAIFETSKWATVEARFPWRSFPRVTRYFASTMLAQDFADVPSNFTDEEIATWNQLVEKYPLPPQTDEERKQREAAFWGSQCAFLIEDKGGGTPVLRSKAMVIDHWWRYERWIFREYYAATGIFIESHWSAEFLDAIAKRRQSRYATGMALREIQTENYASEYIKNAFCLGLPMGKSERERSDREFFYLSYQKQMNDRAERTYEAGLAKKDAHRERWGEWFFVNVERAFLERFYPDDDKEIEKQKAHGDARLATEAEAVAAAAAVGNLRRSSVHDQEF